MSVYITITRGIFGGSIPEKQIRFVNQAAKLGIQQLPLYYYPVASDSDGELSSRLDGILSGFSYNDDIILQMPTLLNEKYDQMLLDKINIFRNESQSKLIMVVHDIEQDSDIIEEKITNYYNQADVLVLPSASYGFYLQEHGLKVNKLVYFQLYDQRTDSLPTPPFTSQVNFLSSSQVNLELYLDNIKVNHWGNSEHALESIPYYMNQAGGFGVIIPTESELFAQKMVPPINTFQYLSANLPIITITGTELAHFITHFNLGMTINDLSEIGKRISQVNIDSYQAMALNIQKIVQAGGFIREALMQAVIMAGLKKIRG